jgi:hypothetical protein
MHGANFFENLKKVLTKRNYCDIILISNKTLGGHHGRKDLKQI